MRFLIPSYKRADKVKTIPYLCDVCGIDKKDIIIQLQDPTDVPLYADKFDCVINYAPASNVAENRNNGLEFVRKEFPSEDIVMMDDDIKYVSLLKKEGNRKTAKVDTLQGEKFIATLKTLFDYSRKHGASIWGISPIDNPFFMKQQVLRNVLLAGVMLGFVEGIYSQGLFFDGTFALKEDYELCLRIMQNGGIVLKFSMLAPRTNYYAPGGCRTTRESSTEQEFADRLLEKYKGIIIADPRRRGEIKLY